MSAHDIDLETCSREELVSKIRNQRIEINNLLGSTEKAVRVIGELRGKLCEAVIHHGPGHQSTTSCQLTGKHETHEANLAGQVVEWEDEE